MRVQTMQRMRQINGFTLIEIIVVIVILGVLAAASSNMISEGFNSYFLSKQLNDADWQSKLAISRMTQDILMIRSPTDISTATAHQLTFTNLSGNSISYALSGTNLQLNSQTLAQGITGLTFTYLDRNEAVLSTIVLANIRYVSFALNVTQNNVNYTLNATVNPRNLVP